MVREWSSSKLTVAPSVPVSVHDPDRSSCGSVPAGQARIQGDGEETCQAHGSVGHRRFSHDGMGWHGSGSPDSAALPGHFSILALDGVAVNGGTARDPDGIVGSSTR